jgi:hypothetical protein
MRRTTISVMRTRQHIGGFSILIQPHTIEPSAHKRDQAALSVRQTGPAAVSDLPSAFPHGALHELPARVNSQKIRGQ